MQAQTVRPKGCAVAVQHIRRVSQGTTGFQELSVESSGREDPLLAKFTFMLQFINFTITWYGWG